MSACCGEKEKRKRGMEKEKAYWFVFCVLRFAFCVLRLICVCVFCADCPLVS